MCEVEDNGSMYSSEFERITKRSLILLFLVVMQASAKYTNLMYAVITLAGCMSVAAHADRIYKYNNRITKFTVMAVVQGMMLILLEVEAIVAGTGLYNWMHVAATAAVETGVMGLMMLVAAGAEAGEEEESKVLDGRWAESSEINEWAEQKGYTKYVCIDALQVITAIADEQKDGSEAARKVLLYLADMHSIDKKIKLGIAGTVACKKTKFGWTTLSLTEALIIKGAGYIDVKSIEKLLIILSSGEETERNTLKELLGIFKDAVSEKQLKEEAAMEAVQRDYKELIENTACIEGWQYGFAVKVEELRKNSSDWTNDFIKMLEGIIKEAENNECCYSIEDNLTVLENVKRHLGYVKELKHVQESSLSETDNWESLSNERIAEIINNSIGDGIKLTEHDIAAAKKMESRW